MIKALIEIVTGSDSITGFLSFARRFSVAGSLFLGSVALTFGASSQAGHPQRNQEATRSDWQIKCVAPGKAKAISLTMNDAKIRYALRHGVTSFIIRLADPAQRRYFTLVNENMAVEGNLSIAIANEPLALNNPKWRVVDGAIPFRHKRLFALSLIGVEAKFVKLTFRVDNSEKITRREEPVGPANRFTVQP